MSDTEKVELTLSGDFTGDDCKGTIAEMSKAYERCQNREEVVSPG